MHECIFRAAQRNAHNRHCENAVQLGGVRGNPRPLTTFQHKYHSGGYGSPRPPDSQSKNPACRCGLAMTGGVRFHIRLKRTVVLLRRFRAGVAPCPYGKRRTKPRRAGISEAHPRRGFPREAGRGTQFPTNLGPFPTGLVPVPHEARGTSLRRGPRQDCLPPWLLPPRLVTGRGSCQRS